MSNLWVLFSTAIKVGTCQRQPKNTSGIESSFLHGKKGGKWLEVAKTAKCVVYRWQSFEPWSFWIVLLPMNIKCEHFSGGAHIFSHYFGIIRTLASPLTGSSDEEKSFPRNRIKSFTNIIWIHELFSSHSGELLHHSEIQKSTEVTTSMWTVWESVALHWKRSVRCIRYRSITLIISWLNAMNNAVFPCYI